MGAHNVYSVLSKHLICLIITNALEILVRSVKWSKTVLCECQTINLAMTQFVTFFSVTTLLGTLLVR